MVKIKDVKLGVVPRVVVSVDDTIPAPSIRRVKEKGADILEARIDRFKKMDIEYVVQKVNMLKRHKMPIIATVRSRKEGGARNILEWERLKLFERVMPLVDAVDIELYSNILCQVISRAHRDGKAGIISFHNFRDTPTHRGLEEIIETAMDKKADIIKIATFAREPADLLRLMEITLKHKDKNLIAISLGNNSAISRVFFPFFGSLLTYTYINAPSGPGQIPFNTLINELRLYYPKFKRAP